MKAAGQRSVPWIVYLIFVETKHCTVLNGTKSCICFLCSQKMTSANHVIYAILKFLDDQQRSPDLTPDAIESLEGNSSSLLLN